MKIKAYIRLQDCTSKKTPDGEPRRAFVQRSQNEHGIAKGRIRYFAVEGRSWAHIRSVLKTFDVMGHSMCSPVTVCGFVKDIGDAAGKLELLTHDEVPIAARIENVRNRNDAPELYLLRMSGR